ncbi:MAG: hypothetical protein IPI03_01895 [Rubrivivax sp.]|nr:hypothetical protein [Rubrivivax sp.]MBK8526375.1 hypothetical protein [Rubrivivax sp.]
MGNSSPRLRTAESRPQIVRKIHFFYLQHGRSAFATSAWYDTWTANIDTITSLSLSIDGQLATSPFCPTRQLPTGTDAFRSDQGWVSLSAKFIVYDLGRLAYCAEEDLDECGYSDVPHPMPMAIFTARYSGDDELPLDFKYEGNLSFQVTAGHRYLAVGTLNLEATNGGEIDFFNTFRLSGVNAPRGALFSGGANGDLVGYFDRTDPGGNDVPTPATLWLLLAAGAAARISRSRSRHS